MSNSLLKKVRQQFGRETAKVLLSPLLSWKPLANATPGFSLIIGVPWHLRHLLPVNLEFVNRTDLRELEEVHVVFDRKHHPSFDELESQARSRFPQLPLTFHHYTGLAGTIIEKLDVSTFYNSMNTTLALGKCRSKYAILHDFDLFPLRADYFTEVHAAMRTRDLRFCGLELTRFHGLTDEDRILGTWCLGIDVEWLRSHYRPVECFHKTVTMGERTVSLDPFSWIQTQTERRDLVATVDEGDCCHVKNLCSTYLRFMTGRHAKVAWRLHYVWYLESLLGKMDNFRAACDAMLNAKGSLLQVGECATDFAGTDPTCANVLRDELTRMEQFLHGHCRPEVIAYVNAFESFLGRSHHPQGGSQPAVDDTQERL